MPQHQEKKYRVANFDRIKAQLAKLGSMQDRKSESTHYYATRPDNNVLKLVAKSSGFEIHELEETDGKFELKKSLKVGTLGAGLAWLKAQGYEAVSVVRMQHTDYRHMDGLIGLYMINHALNSVILDFPEGHHDEVASELGLDKAELIELPYNKYLEREGILEPVVIDELDG